MKKKKKYLVVMLVVVLAVVAVAAVLLLTSEQTEDGESSLSSAESSEGTTQELVAVDAADVTSITITLPYDEYVLLPVTADEEIGFTIQGLEDFDLSESDITTLANGLLQVSSTKSVGEKEDLSAFGLVANDDMESGDGGVTVAIETAEGTITYLVGATAPESGGRYVALRDDKEVYIATVSASVFNKAYDYVSKELYTVVDIIATDDEGNETVEADSLTSLSISGSNYPDSVAITSSSSISGYVMTEPMKADASPDRMSEMITLLKTVTASGVAKAPYEEGDLKDYGLDTPCAVVEYSMNGEKHTIALGDRSESGDRYMIADEFGIIYTISDESVSAWADSNVLTLRSSYIMLPNIKDVKMLTLSVNGKETVLEAERVLNEEKSTEEEPSYDLKVTLAGKEISYDDVYQPLYKELISIAVLSVDAVQYDNSAPKMTVEYAYYTQAGTDAISFFTLDDNNERYVVELNGEYHGIIRRTSLDSIIELIEAL